MKVGVSKTGNVRIGEIYNLIELEARDETWYICERDGHFEVEKSTQAGHIQTLPSALGEEKPAAGADIARI